MKNQFLAATFLFASLSTPPAFAGDTNIVDLGGDSSSLSTSKGSFKHEGSETKECGGWDTYQIGPINVFFGQPDCDVDQWRVAE